MGPSTCAEAAGPYAMSSVMLDASIVPAPTASGFGSDLFTQLPVAVDPSNNRVYVGLTQAAGDSFDAVIAGDDGSVASVPGASNGGIAITSDGLGVLLFDPNPTVDDRVWASVARVGFDGSVAFNVDLFRSPNLEDVGTKGAPSTSRFGYLPDSDQLVAYFAHTQRYDDGVRHQGGYLALIDSEGGVDRLSEWFGSHNLDQRLLVSASSAAVVGLGDAYPEGIFFSFLDDARTNVIYPLAAAGNGATNGQLGGAVDLGENVVVPFITNNSVPQDLDAGTWPDIDEAIADQIRAAAANGTDLGLLSVAKGEELPREGGLTATFLESGLGEGSRLVRLKSAQYGTGGLILLLWAEATGSGRSSAISGYYAMVVDANGAVCQAKTELGAGFGFTAGDDVVRRPDGSIVWANAENDAVNIVTLTPQ
ncbi:MAG TPA: hypothetical protein VF989_06095 [Polyangiaceae bacterium]